MLQDEKPDLSELAHFGVKGMKWGVRKNRAPRPSSQDIKDARARQQGRVIDILSANKKFYDNPSKETENALAKAKYEFLSSPDRVTAQRMTKGEKWMMAALIAASGPGAPISAGLSLGYQNVKVRRLKKDTAKRRAAGM